MAWGWDESEIAVTIAGHKQRWEGHFLCMGAHAWSCLYLPYRAQPG